MENNNNDDYFIRRNNYLSKIVEEQEKIQEEKKIYDKIKEENIKVDWKSRISYVDFFNYFIEWKRINEPHYKYLNMVMYDKMY